MNIRFFVLTAQLLLMEKETRSVEIRKADPMEPNSFDIIQVEFDNRNSERCFVRRTFSLQFQNRLYDIKTSEFNDMVARAADEIIQTMRKDIANTKVKAPPAPIPSFLPSDGKPMDYEDELGVWWVMCACGHRIGGSARPGDKITACVNCRFLYGYSSEGKMEIVYPDRLPTNGLFTEEGDHPDHIAEREAYRIKQEKRDKAKARRLARKVANGQTKPGL